MKNPLYQASSQYKNWRFSKSQLIQIRTSLNEAAVKTIRDKFEADELGSSSDILFLNANEECLLIKLYIAKVAQLCGLFRFPEEVEATAIAYLKRFYLKNTVMDWHPKNVMLTALFLATKTTNNPISLETYTTHIPNTSPSDVLDLEFLVAQSLGFEFAVWHAHRALWGIWLDLQSLPEHSIAVPENAYDDALSYVRASRLTDAELLFTPSQIALSALSLVAPDIASQWSKLKVHQEHVDTRLASNTFKNVIEEVKHIITTQGHGPDVESVREVDRRLKICKNPEKVAGSKAYQAKKQEEERKAEEKRNKKAADATRLMYEGDPFGIELDETRRGLVDYDDDDDDDDD